MKQSSSILLIPFKFVFSFSKRIRIDIIYYQNILLVEFYVYIISWLWVHLDEWWKCKPWIGKWLIQYLIVVIWWFSVRARHASLRRFTTIWERDLFRREAKTSYPVSDWETPRSNHWNNQGSHFVRRFDRCHRHSRCRQRVTCKV